MRAAIARQFGNHYLPAMTSVLLRFATLLALLLMPVGMATAPVAAQAAATAAAGHCDEHQEPADAPSSPQAHCAGCVALPAADVPAAVAGLVPQAPVVIALTTPISEREPEIATPPPKLS